MVADLGALVGDGLEGLVGAGTGKLLQFVAAVHRAVGEFHSDAGVLEQGGPVAIDGVGEALACGDIHHQTSVG